MKDAAITPELHAIAAESMAEWKVPGVAVAVVQENETTLLKAYGQRDVEAGLPVTAETQFTICSITKTFTAAGLAMLVDQGLLDWTKPVRDYVPEFRLHDPIATDRITVRATCSAITVACRAMTGSGCRVISPPPRCSQPCAISNRA